VLPQSSDGNTLNALYAKLSQKCGDALSDCPRGQASLFAKTIFLVVFGIPSTSTLFYYYTFINNLEKCGARDYKI